MTDSTLPVAGDTAGSSVVADVPVCGPQETIAVVKVRVAERRNPHDAVVCIVGEDRSLLGTLPVATLLTAPEGATALERADREPATVPVDADQEQMAHVALRRDAAHVVVVTRAGRLVGVVPPVALMRVLYREHEEDLHKLAGIAREDAMIKDALDAPPRRRTRDRLPWLLVGLAGSAVATFVAAQFETTLQAKVAVSFFIPGLVYLADAVGTQTEAIVVRGLAHSENRAQPGRLLRGELSTGAMIGAVLALLVLPSVWLAFTDLRLAAAVALSLFFATIAATTIGMLLPWALHRRGIDPAFGSGPLATVAQDILTLAVYLSVVRLLL